MNDHFQGAPYPNEGPPAAGFAPPPGMYPNPNAPSDFNLGYGPPQPQPGYGPPPAGYGAPQPQGFYPPPTQPGYPPVINQQPTYPAPGGGAPPIGGDWMPLPPQQVLIPNCPPGLEYLTTVDSLYIKQKVELLEAFIGFETNNKYTIKNNLGQKVFWAIEDNDCCTRNCCGPARPFEMQITDAHHQEVIHLSRDLRCDSCCCPCCLQRLEVTSPPGNVIGTIEQDWSILSPVFSIKNESGETVLKIEGPFCTFSICGDVEFKLMTLDGKQVGKISKQWSGFARELFTDSDFFGITFPMDLDVKMKAVMIGACFLIVSSFNFPFENSTQIF